jgi:hypothetical protein
MITRFPTLKLEGGLISSDQIDRIADQKVKEFSIDDIAAAWSDIHSYWTIFQNNLAKLPDNDLGTSITRNRWMMPFFSTLGYELSASKTAAEVDGQTYAISHRAGKEDSSPPIHIVGIRQSLDRRSESGRPRLAPHSLVQEYLNRTEHLWGIVTNGSSLRILRDSHLLRKQAYIEFDLDQMMKDELFADFALLFRLIHVSRLPKSGEDASSCLLEQYHKQTVDQGGRVRDHLRDGVEKALTGFANGFLSHPRNTTLRAKVQDKSLESFEYYQQLLRLIYRFLFLMVSEERNLIADDMAYRKHYSISRIRRLAEVRAAYTNQEDLWLGLATSFKLFQDEEVGSLLAVPTLNGDLFDPVRTFEINSTSLTNHDLLTAMWDICMYREKDSSPWRRINYAALDIEELGSVYESLLDFQPVFLQQNGKLTFALLTGTERKSTGSYYTPPELVNELIQSALKPVIKDRLISIKTPAEKETALLALSVCDPACGSGHFLLAAARTIGRELAKARTGDEEPAPEQMRIAVRDVITHCIYGVDKNPLAVDLCKVALWLEGHTKSKPLTFLDHRIRCGDSLVGVFDLAVLKEGIPDEAYNAVVGDDKAIARELKKQNRNEKLHRSLTEFDASMNVLTASRLQVNSISDDTPDDIRKKKEIFSAFQQEGTLWCRDKTACDLWTTAFFVGFNKENVQLHLIPTTDILRRYLTGNLEKENPAVHLARRYASQHRFFHWKLEFPEIFLQGGFDCVLGNPPWEKTKIIEKEWFIGKNDEIASCTEKNQRARLINALINTKPALYQEWLDTLRFSNNYSSFVTNSMRFKLSAIGDLNTYSLFTELSGIFLINKSGRAGIIVKTGIATDYYTQKLFSFFVEKRLIVSLFDFINKELIFPDVAPIERFCLLTISGIDATIGKTKFSFYNTNPNNVRDQGRIYYLSTNELQLLNPNTNTCPSFFTNEDKEITLKIYKNNTIIENEKIKQNPLGMRYYRMFDMTNDSNLFSQNTYESLLSNNFKIFAGKFLKGQEVFLPLYEAKFINIFDYRFGTFENVSKERRFIARAQPHPVSEEQKKDPYYGITPRYWINEIKFKEKHGLNWNKKWIFAFRDLTRKSSDSRCGMGTILPFFPIGNTAAAVTFEKQNSDIIAVLFCATFSSIVFDYIIRQKMGGAHLNAFILKQLPIIPLDRYTPANLAFIVPRVLELTYTAWDIKTFADDVWRDADNEMRALLCQQWEDNKAVTGGHEWKPPEWADIVDDGIHLAPFKWEDERRAGLRAGLDALYAKLYGLSRDELRYILDPIDIYGPEFPGETFRVLKEKEIRQYGEYRTKRLILEAWDRFIK